MGAVKFFGQEGRFRAEMWAFAFVKYKFFGELVLRIARAPTWSGSVNDRAARIRRPAAGKALAHWPA